MKKIAIIVPSYKPVPDVRGGGVEQLVTNLIENNEDKKYFNIDLYTIYDKKICEYKYDYTRLITIKKNKLKVLVEKVLNRILKVLNIEYIFDYYNNSVKKIINTNEYEYIIVENNMYLYKKIYSEKSKAKFIFHLHNDFGNRDKPIRLCKFISKTAKIVITCSDYLNNKFTNTTKSHNTYTLDNCIDFSNFTYSKKEREKLRNKLAINDDTIALLYIGRISYDKGIIELLKSFSTYQKNKKYKLLIIGDKENADLNTVKKFDYYINRNKNVVYFGKIDNSQIYKYISASDCVIIPTIVEEAFGLVALESLACSKSVIVTNSGALPYLVDDSCGFVIDRNNFDRDLFSILDNINIVELREKGIYGKRKVKNNKAYSSKYYLDNLMSIISEKEDNR